MSHCVFQQNFKYSVYNPNVVNFLHAISSSLWLTLMHSSAFSRWSLSRGWLWCNANEGIFYTCVLVFRSFEIPLRSATYYPPYYSKWFKHLWLRFLHFELWERGTSKILLVVSRHDYEDPIQAPKSRGARSVDRLVEERGWCSALPLPEVPMETLPLLKLALCTASFQDLRKGVIYMMCRGAQLDRTLQQPSSALLLPHQALTQKAASSRSRVRTTQTPATKKGFPHGRFQTADPLRNKSMLSQEARSLHQAGN